MRTRTKSNLLTTDNFSLSNRFSQQWSNVSSGAIVNTYLLPSWNYTIATRSDVSTIVDDNSRKCVNTKEVTHSSRVHRKVLSNTDILISGNDKFTTVDSVVNSAHWRVWGSYGDIFPEHIQIQWDKSDDTLIRDAKDRFYNANDVDNVLNAVEAPDFISGLKSLHDNVNVPVVSSKKAKILLRARKATKFISGGFLYYSFGIAPLIADIKKMAHATKTYSRRMQKALDNAGKVESLHSRCGGKFTGILTPGNGLPLPVGYGVSGDGSVWHSQIQSMLTPLKVVTIRGIRSHKYTSPLFQKLDYLATRFGSIGPASFAWEKIPYSFVVDWFVDTSDVFNKLDNFLTGSRKNIVDASISEKWECAAGAVKHVTGTTHSSSDGIQTAVNELAYYHRKPIDPYFSVGLSGRFGKRQVALSAALLGQKAANLKLKR